ncbi:hypothetical protein HDU99_000379 [Rhizoclosmatium hyalinum]|nr:hypothetical protein HDU99_000379 [Rhizoclosmatium hyalinum]
MGITAVLSLVVGQAIQQYVPNGSTDDKVTYAITLAFWTGLFMLLLGLFRLAVVAGFTAGAGIQAIVGQFPGLLGIKGVNTNNAPYQILYDFLVNLGGTQKYDAIIGITSLFAILFLKYATAYGVKKGYTWLKYIGFLRNAIVLGVYIGVAYALKDNKSVPIALVKDIPSGLSGVRGPSFDLNFASSKVFPAIPGVFLVAVLEHIAVTKTYGRINGYTVDANQEIVAIGLANFVGSFIGSVPATGSFSRSAIKSASGVRTPFGSFFTGATVVIGLFTITGALYYMPSATLCAIVITAISELVAKFDVIFVLIKVDLLDSLGFIIAFVVTFFSTLENAVYAAAAYSLVVLLLRVARPKVEILARTDKGLWLGEDSDSYKHLVEANAADSEIPEGILVFKIDESLSYPNSSYFIDQLKSTIIQRFRYTNPVVRTKGERMWNDDVLERVQRRERLGLTELPALRAIVFDFSAVSQVDYTGIQALLDSKDDLERYTGRPVPFYYVGARKRHLHALIGTVQDHVTAADLDLSPAAEGTKKAKGIFNVFPALHNSDEEVETRKLKQKKALQFFHYSVDEAVEAADRRTQSILAEIGQVKTVSSA